MQYELTEEEYKTLMDACKPVPYIVVGGVSPPSPQENANRAWKALAEKRGFKWNTVRPVPGKSDRWFSAEPSS